MNTIKVKNIAELKTRKGTPESVVEVLGYYIEGDLGSGNFYWDALSTETDNGGTILSVSSATTFYMRSSTSVDTTWTSWFKYTGVAV